MTERARVDPELCIGSAECVRLLPLAFALDDAAGVSTVLATEVDASLDALVEAALNCPTNAIRVVGDDGEVVVASNG